MKSSSSLSLSAGTSLATVESLSMPLFQEVVLSSDIRCTGCQSRLAEMMSKMGDIESVVVSAPEKKVTLICRYPITAAAKAPVHCCMVMRLNVDCNGCVRKVRRVLLNMKAIETHLIEKQQCRVSVCGRFIPADVAIKMRKKMNRRVEILDIQEFDESTTEHHQRTLVTVAY